MSAFFDSLRADLLDRRLRPLLALLALALIGAIVYAVTAGSGSSTPTATSSPSPGASTGVVVSAAKTESAKAVAETTGGAANQTIGGSTRNPFTPLPQPKAKSTATASGSGASSSSSSSSGVSESSSGAGSGSGSGSSSESGSGAGSKSESGSSNSGGTSPSKKKSGQANPRTLYAVAVLLGTAVPGTPAPNAELTLYEGLKLQQPLPSAKEPLVVYRGVMAGGKSATFTLVGEVILRGSATCIPSAAQCTSIALQPGQTEELELTPPGAAPVTYDLYVVAIYTLKRTSAPFAKGASARESKAGRALLRSRGLEQLPGLRYSAAKGVLVPVHRRRFAARAHAAALDVLGSEPQGLSASK